LLAIADYHKIDVISSAPTPDCFVDPFRVVNVQEATSWFAEEPGVVLDSFAFGRSVNDAEHSFEMFLQQLK